MSAWRRWLLVAWLVAIVPRAGGHETDQFTIPPGRQFADLGGYFNRWAYQALAHGVEKANVQIRAALARNAPASVVADLQSPSRVTMAVRNQWPWSVTQIEAFEGKLRSPEMRRRYPGRVVAYGDRFGGVYQFAFFPLDIRQFGHLLFFSSTIKVYGTYMGTDKLGHFTDEGITYYYAYRKARDAGVGEALAVAAAVTIGTDGLMSERGMLGLLANADYSNGDLAANFAGFLFYRNLTEPVWIKGQLRPPMLVRDGPFWMLRPDIRADSDFFARFISDHLDEALNPGYFEPYLRPAMREAVRARSVSLLRHYADSDGRPRDRQWFDQKLREVSSYWGVDYGHLGRYHELVSIGNSCFPDSPAQTVQLASGGDPTVLFRTGAGDEASPNLKSEILDHDRPSQFASQRNSKASRLLAFGAAPRSHDSFGYTPLHDAARNGMADVAQRLLATGADACARDDAGTTPLHLACRHGKIEVARLLLEAGAEVNAASDAGVTPLHEAALAGDLPLVRLLLSRGARPESRDARGRTPADIAAVNGYDDVLRALPGPHGANH